jgi:hypothetical protein
MRGKMSTRKSIRSTPPLNLSHRFDNTELDLKKIIVKACTEFRTRSSNGCFEQGKKPSGSIEVRNLLTGVWLLKKESAPWC